MSSSWSMVAFSSLKTGSKSLVARWLSSSQAVLLTLFVRCLMASLIFFVVSPSIGFSACACSSASTACLMPRGAGDARGPLLSVTLSMR